MAVGSFSAIWIEFFLLGNSWFQLLLAGLLGVLLTQFGFLGHDAAHRQIFRSAAWNDWASRILAGFAGLSHGWWRTKHNLHHAAPNQEGRDPDIGPGAIAFTPAIAAERAWGVPGWFVRHQGCQLRRGGAPGVLRHRRRLPQPRGAAGPRPVRVPDHRPVPHLTPI